MSIDLASIYENFWISYVHFCEIGRNMLRNLSLVSSRCPQTPKPLALPRAFKSIGGSPETDAQFMGSWFSWLTAEHNCFNVHILCSFTKEILLCLQVSCDRPSQQLQTLQPTGDDWSGFTVPCVIQFFWDTSASSRLFS